MKKLFSLVIICITFIYFGCSIFSTIPATIRNNIVTDWVGRTVWTKIDIYKTTVIGEKPSGKITIPKDSKIIISDIKYRPAMIFYIKDAAGNTGEITLWSNDNFNNTIFQKRLNNTFSLNNPTDKKTKDFYLYKSKVQTSCARIFNGPDIRSGTNVISILRTGTKLFIVNEENGFYKVRLRLDNPWYGWIQKKDLDKIEESPMAATKHQFSRGTEYKMSIRKGDNSYGISYGMGYNRILAIGSIDYKPGDIIKKEYTASKDYSVDLSQLTPEKTYQSDLIIFSLGLGKIFFNDRLLAGAYLGMGWSEETQIFLKDSAYYGKKSGIQREILFGGSIEFRLFNSIGIGCDYNTINGLSWMASLSFDL